jgi:hypothetical protein
MVKSITNQPAKVDGIGVSGRKAAQTTDGASDSRDSYRSVNPYVSTMKLPSIPPSKNSIWHDLRVRFYDYLRKSKPGQPLWMYVDFSVDEDVERMVTSKHRRYIELEIDPNRLRETFDFTVRGVMSELPVLRESAANVLLRLAEAHIDEESPYVIQTFEAAKWLLDHSRTHIGDRHVAAKVMVHTNPCLPDVFPQAYGAALALRASLVEQRVDALALTKAYRGLIHCLSPEHIEVNEGVATFSGIARTTEDESLKLSSREIILGLSELKKNVGRVVQNVLKPVARPVTPFRK